MTIGSVLARIGEIQSRFGFSTGLASPVVDNARLAGFDIDEILEIVTSETEKVAGAEAANTLEATLLDALTVQRGDSGVLAPTLLPTPLDGAGAVPGVPASFGGPAVFPVAGYSVGSGYGQRSDPFDGTTRLHKGVDITAPVGTSIVAASAGEVTWAGPRGSYGNLVVVRHDDHNETRYAHQSKVLVGVGDIVSAGQIVGEVGSTGRSTGAHLHFEARVDGDAVDPVKWIAERRL